MTGWYGRRRIGLAALCAFIVFASPGALILANAATDTPSGAVGGEVMVISRSDQALKLRLTPGGSGPAGKTAAAGGEERKALVELLTLEGELKARLDMQHSGEPFEVELALDGAADPVEHYLRYRFDDNGVFAQRSLALLLPTVEVRMLGQPALVASSRAVVRAFVTGGAGHEAIKGARATLRLGASATYKATTDGRGEAIFDVQVPGTPGERILYILTVVTGSGARETIDGEFTVTARTRTLLTTDKPIYQPGQTIHIRALTLTGMEDRPLAQSPVRFEVEDSKGNKVMKVPALSNSFGVSHAEFTLAREVNMGAYKVRAVARVGAAEAVEEKTVTVDRYVLPKFKVGAQPDKPSYKPGEKARVSISADYFFGEPVAGGKVRISASAFDVEYREFASVEAVLDSSGGYTAELEIPDYLVGQPVEGNNASVLVEVAVTDGAGHVQKVVKNLPVATVPIVVALVPEAGDIRPGIENRLYVVTTTPAGEPLPCAVRWVNPPGGVKTLEASTDEGGFGRLVFTAPGGGYAKLPVRLEVRSRDGRERTLNIDVDVQGGGTPLILRSSKALAKTGDTVAFETLAARKSGPVFLDLVKNGQTVLTRTLELKDGRATVGVSIDDSLAGTLVANAYLIASDGTIHGDSRVLLVEPAGGLDVKVEPDRAEYRPGDTARLKFAVTDSGGNPTVAAIGVIVVDEAVFALSELQPGLEKVYFYLERQLATPRYEVHGYALGEVSPFAPAPTHGAMAPALREKAARVLLAGAAPAPGYGIDRRAGGNAGLMHRFDQRMAELLSGRAEPVKSALAEFSSSWKRMFKSKADEGIGIGRLVDEGYLKKPDALDPWGHRLKISGSWNVSEQDYDYFSLQSPGIDGVWGTDDDVETPRVWSARLERRLRGGDVRLMAVMDEAAMPMVAKAAAVEVGGAGGKPDQGAGPVRVREHFPETLYFRPSVITDSRGLAEVPVVLADSITTWRATASASSARGALGSATAPIKVFQPFFVDIDFPVKLTRNDKVWVPVAVYNYLERPQTVTLTADAGEGFELGSGAELSVELKPGEVRSVYFQLTAVKAGLQSFTVTGRGGQGVADAIKRTVEVVPDGERENVDFSGKLGAQVAHEVAFPQEAIEGANSLMLYLYPGALSQLAEGLDALLRMPFGCFEQTSSATYPNVLVLDYLKETGKITPELRMKAEGFVTTGYQRLLSFEVDGGGFEWFGNAPAHPILTAYGLMEFADMSRVHEVDPAVISRTARWLMGLQREDGSFAPNATGIREGAIDKFTDDTFRATAYIGLALAEALPDEAGGAVGRAARYLSANADAVEDPYTLSLACNFFALAEPGSATADVLFKKLVAGAVTEGNRSWWRAASPTPTFGDGKVADIEVTGLAVQALVRGEREPALVSRAVTWLVSGKDSYGTWHSTQATIQALRALITAERLMKGTGEATVTVTVDGKTHSTMVIDEESSDVLRMIELSSLATPGGHLVELKTESGEAGEEASFFYRLSGSYWLERGSAPKGGAPEEPMRITVRYDRTELAVNDTIGVSATVENLRPLAARMVIVDLGLPPGFTLETDKLDELVASGAVAKYEVAGRQLVVYLEEVEAEKAVTVEYGLRARFPLEAETGEAGVYEYYNPEVKAGATPVRVKVRQ